MLKFHLFLKGVVHNLINNELVPLRKCNNLVEQEINNLITLTVLTKEIVRCLPNQGRVFNIGLIMTLHIPRFNTIWNKILIGIRNVFLKFKIKWKLASVLMLNPIYHLMLKKIYLIYPPKGQQSNIFQEIQVE